MLTDQSFYTSVLYQPVSPLESAGDVPVLPDAQRLCGQWLELVGLLLKDLLGPQCSSGLTLPQQTADTASYRRRVRVSPAGGEPGLWTWRGRGAALRCVSTTEMLCSHYIIYLIIMYVFSSLENSLVASHAIIDRKVKCNHPVFNTYLLDTYIFSTLICMLYVIQTLLFKSSVSVSKNTFCKEKSMIFFKEILNTLYLINT